MSKMNKEEADAIIKEYTELPPIESCTRTQSENPPKFHIGDLVCTKYTGLPGTMKVVGVVPGFLSYTFVVSGKGLQAASSMYSIFSNIDPLWYIKHAYYCIYSKPQKSISFEEFKAANPNMKEEFLQQEYDNVPEVPMCLACEEDLALFDEDEE